MSSFCRGCRSRTSSNGSAAGGSEIGSGKFAHPESSAALAVNAFGWFIERPALFPALPGMEDAGPVERVEVEYSARFPWPGGRHPWLDAAAFTETHLVGVESKRFEPFRDAKSVSLSSSYDRPVWGDNMTRYSKVRDALRSGKLRFRHLDAAQLVKHAYGLVTDAGRAGLEPVLVYIFAEPSRGLNQQISEADHARHRAEVDAFATAVSGDAVRFASIAYHDWLAEWGEAGVVEHASNLRNAFAI